MVNRMRATRAHRDNRRAHHALEAARLSKCPDCGSMHLRHRVCANCGKYKGMQIIDVAKAITKKEKKIKAREKTAAESK